MRSVVVVAALCVLATPAIACPPGAPCLAIERPLRATIEARPEHPRAAEASPVQPRPAPRVDLTLPPTTMIARSTWTFGAAPREVPGVEPEIWHGLRRQVSDHLPRFDSGAVSFMIAPVVVAGIDDTVPGLGIAGHF